MRCNLHGSWFIYVITYQLEDRKFTPALINLQKTTLQKKEEMNCQPILCRGPRKGNINYNQCPTILAE